MTSETARHEVYFRERTAPPWRLVGLAESEAEATALMFDLMARRGLGDWRVGPVQDYPVAGGRPAGANRPVG